nr:MAG TPA: hypothetical protein [Caudoviricetes sp.]
MRFPEASPLIGYDMLFYGKPYRLHQKTCVFVQKTYPKIGFHISEIS